MEFWYTDFQFSASQSAQGNIVEILWVLLAPLINQTSIHPRLAQTRQAPYL